MKLRCDPANDFVISLLLLFKDKRFFLFCFFFTILFILFNFFNTVKMGLPLSVTPATGSHTLISTVPYTDWLTYPLTGRFTADNLNKAKNLCSKSIGEKMKVQKHGHELTEQVFDLCKVEWERRNNCHYPHLRVYNFRTTFLPFTNTCLCCECRGRNQLGRMSLHLRKHRTWSPSQLKHCLYVFKAFITTSSSCVFVKLIFDEADTDSKHTNCSTSCLHFSVSGPDSKPD